MIELTAATFPSANHGFIACSSNPSPVNGVPVRIMIQPGMMAGDRIELKTQGYSTANGMDPVPGTETTGVYTLGSIGGESFVELNVGPYATAIKPIRSGSLGAQYSVERNGVDIGESKRALVKIDLNLPGGGTCPE